MKTFIALALLTVAVTPAFALDSEPAEIPAADLALIRSVLPAKAVLAGTYSLEFDEKADRMVFKKNDQKYLNSSYVRADLNKDGKLDLAVAIELPPANPSMAIVDSEGEAVKDPARKLLVFISDASGKLVKVAQGDNAIMGVSDGGVMGDPFMGLSANAKGSLVVNHFGGSSQKWDYTETYQFRNGTMFLIGKTEKSIDGARGDISTTDTNLLTGDQKIITGNLESEETVKVKTRKIQVKPLIPMAKVKVGY